MTITPINENVLIQVKAAEVMKSGLHVVNANEDKTEAIAIKGSVVSLAKDAKTNVKAGDLVAVAKWEGQVLNVEGEKYIVIKPKDILAILSD